MLDQGKFKEIRQTSVGKDDEKVSSRVKEVWLALPKPQREEILNLSGLTVHAATRTYQKGKISLKLALALAQSQKINPFFLSGASDDRDNFSDEIIDQFLIEHGHSELTEKSGGKQPKKANGSKTQAPKNLETNAVENKTPIVSTEANTEKANDGKANPVETITDTASLETPTDIVIESEEDVPPANTMPVVSIASVSDLKPEQPPTAYDKLLAVIQEKVRAITESEQEKLNGMPVETAEQLLRGLYLRTEFSEDANYLASLVKMLLVL